MAGAHHRLLIARRTVQIGTLAAFAISATYGLRVLTGSLSASLLFDTVPLTDPLALAQMLVAGHVPHVSTFVGALIALAVYGLLLGRAYCSWVCPINLLSDAAAALNRRFRLGQVLRISRHTRYWLLGLTILLSALLKVGAFEWVSPIGIAARAVIYGSVVGLWALAALFLFELVLLPHGFCGHLCPVGAMWSLVGRFAKLKVRIEPDKCTHCMQCQTICPERQVITPLLQKVPALVVTDGACTRCARCVEVCEPNALRLTVLPPATHLAKGGSS